MSAAPNDPHFIDDGHQGAVDERTGPSQFSPEIAPSRNPRRAAEHRLRFATEAGRIGVWDFNCLTGELSGSVLFREHVGLATDRPVTFEDVETLIHPQDRDRIRKAFLSLLANGTDYEFDYRVLRPDGRIGWLHVRAQIARNDLGTPTWIAGISFDITERRQAELRLELSEESLRLATEAAEVGTWDLDLTTGILTWSDRTKAMFGISPGVDCSMADFYGGLHPEDYQATATAFASAIDPAIRATYDVEYRTIGKEDGIVRWVAAKGKGLFAHGACRRALGTAVDITARKRAAMRQSFLLDLLDRLRLLTDPIAILDTAIGALGRHLGACRIGYGKVQADNATIVLETCHVDGVEPLTGPFELASFGPDSIARQRLGMTVVVDDVNADAMTDPAIWAAIGVRAYASVPLVRDGRFTASLYVNHRHPHCWSADEVALIEEVAGRIWDALERARAEEALRQLNAALERQVEYRTREIDRTWRLAPMVMVVGGSDGALLEVNPAWTDLLGWTRSETIGRNVMEFVAPEDREIGAAGMQRLFGGLPVVELQIGFLARNGARRRIAWTTVPEGNRLYGYGRDVTDQVAAEEQLRQAQKMEAVGQLTGGLAHDFNNLLTGIAGSLELTQRRLRQARYTEAESFIETAQGAARRAASLTQRLLAFARRQTLDPKPTDVNSLVRGMEDLIRRTVGPELKIDVAAAAELWTVLVDPHQLESALLNLCLNARDAMPDGGRVTIATSNLELDETAALPRELAPGPYVSLAVTDTGTGMTEEVARRAFDPFFTTKPLGSGTGLGLSMIYGFVRQSGGQVVIQSELCRGTTVTLYLPRNFDPVDGVEIPHATARSDPTDKGETVLVVDDEADVRTLACAVLREQGYAAVEAVDGAEGLRILQSRRRIDLLVTDVGLPGGMNGRQLADAGRAIRPGLPVLFITGYAANAVLGNAQLERGMQVLTKPFALEMLASRVQDLITESSRNMGG